MQNNQLSVQSLNSLFPHFQNMPNTVFWMRDVNYSRQVYVSQNFQDLWHTKTDQLYEHPESWADLLIPDDEKILEVVNARVGGELDDNVMYYRTKGDGITPGHVKDTVYQLIDLEENVIGYAGFAELLKDEQWHYEERGGRQIVERSVNEVKRHVLGALSQDFGVMAQTVSINSKPMPYDKIRLKKSQGLVDTTGRERETLWHLLSGLTAKQTAQKMAISPRTVEFHLNNLKEKSESRNKLELISRVVLK